ncbi:MAG: hypothetical protein ACI9XZ_000945 [Alphaproteobacteria bacterium]
MKRIDFAAFYAIDLSRYSAYKLHFADYSAFVVRIIRNSQEHRP